MGTVNKKGQKLKTTSQEVGIENYQKTQILNSFDLNSYSKLHATSGDVGTGVVAHAAIAGSIFIDLPSNFFIGSNGLSVTAVADYEVIWICKLYLNGVEIIDILPQGYASTNPSPQVIDDFKNCKIIKSSYDNRLEVRYSTQQRIFNKAAYFNLDLSGFWF